MGENHVQSGSFRNTLRPSPRTTEEELPHPLEIAPHASQTVKLH